MTRMIVDGKILLMVSTDHESKSIEELTGPRSCTAADPILQGRIHR